MDRQTISLVKGEIGKDFGNQTNAEFGWVLAAFGMTYALFQIVAGHMVDRWDLRLSYAGAVAWWSLAAIATAFAPSIGVLIAFRCLLGVGESFNWPCALRVTARILPPGDRSLGNGIFNSGAAVGAVVTPVVVTFLTTRFGWRSAFVAIGSAGFIWVFAWLISIRGEYRQRLAYLPAEPSEAKGSDHGLKELPKALDSGARLAFGLVGLVAVAVAGSAPWTGLSSVWLGIAVAMIGPLLVALYLPLDRLQGAHWAISLGEILRNRRFWVLLVVSVSINLCWHFLVNWIPTYLKEERGNDFETGNYLSTIPFVAADFGNLAGGWLSRRLVSQGWEPTRARRLVMAGLIPLILCGVAVGRAPSLTAAVILVSIMAAGTAGFMANYFAFTQEVSRRHTGLVVGYLGGVANLFVAGFQPFAGAIKDVTGSFNSIFVLTGLIPIIGLAVLFWAWDDRSRRPSWADSELR